MPRGPEDEKRPADAIGMRPCSQDEIQDRPHARNAGSRREKTDRDRQRDRGRSHLSAVGRSHQYTQFRDAGGNPDEYRAAVSTAVAHGWIVLHPSGAYLTFSQAGVDLFA
jgi:hypothetical protein